MKLKIIAAAVLATSCAQNIQAEPGYYVIGDSQCEVVIEGAANNAWPHLIQNTTGIYMKNACRAGQSFASGVVYNTIQALNIVPNQSIKGIIIHLGTNDKVLTILYGVSLDFSSHLNEGITEAHSRGLEVICILPPDNSWFTNEDVREIISNNCPVSINASLIVTPEDMPDGAHFGVEGHFKYTEGITNGLTIQ